jgi:hypothetical protein
MIHFESRTLCIKLEYNAEQKQIVSAGTLSLSDIKKILLKGFVLCGFFWLNLFNL